MGVVTALMYAKLTGIDKVLIWFSLPLLLEKDKKLYDHLRDSLEGLDVELVASYTEAKEKTTDKTFLIIDEIDY